jgi:hypothetical protein
MKLKKQMFLPVLLSLSVFFSSTVAMSASACAAAAPASACASAVSAGASSGTVKAVAVREPAGTVSRAAAVRQLAEAAPNNTDIPEADKGKADDSARSGSARSRSDSSFFEDLLEKIAVMFLVYMFIQAINELLNEFFHDGDTKIKITPKENQDLPDGKGTNQKNTKRIPAQEV